MKTEIWNTTRVEMYDMDWKSGSKERLKIFMSIGGLNVLSSKINVITNTTVEKNVSAKYGNGYIILGIYSWHKTATLNIK